MNFEIESPTRAYVSPNGDELTYLRKQLTYKNTSAQYLVKKHYSNIFFKRKNPAGWQARLEELKAAVTNTLIYADSGRMYIRPASIEYLELGKDDTVKNHIVYPEPKKIPWAKPLPFELYDYQEESWLKLLEAKHANVELCTGAGKSAILLKLCRETGFRAAIIAPSKSIFNELLEKFEYHLGKNNVGAFGDGKKKLGKRFTICIGDSIANIKTGSKEWEFFSGLDMIAVDESHTWGADSLDEICHGVLGSIPYRFFFSGTQTRGDGSEKLLQSIIGKTVCRLTTAEAKRRGYICDHEFKIVEIESSNPNYSSRDPLEMKRNHFLRNRNIAAFSAKLANAMALAYKKQTLILVEELGQISMLAKLLTVPWAMAHSETKPDRLQELGLEKVDNAESVEKFNKGEAMVLVGTSCIATGTNIFPTHQTINWVGGSSEIRTKQGSVGRSIRLHNANPWKDKCVYKDKAIIWDFDIVDIDEMSYPLEQRVDYYKESESEITRVRIPR